MNHKHAIPIITVLTVLFVSTFSSLGFAAGSSLVINDQICPGVGGEVTFTISVNNAPNQMSSAGFKISYDESVLAYKQYRKGNLTDGFTMFDVSEHQGGILRVGGLDAGAGIVKGASGTMLELTFTVQKCETSTLQLVDLVDGVANWSATEGKLIVSSMHTQGAAASPSFGVVAMYPWISSPAAFSIFSTPFYSNYGNYAFNTVVNNGNFIGSGYSWLGYGMYPGWYGGYGSNYTYAPFNYGTSFFLGGGHYYGW